MAFAAFFIFKFPFRGEGPWNPLTKGIHELNLQYTNSFFPTIIISRGTEIWEALTTMHNALASGLGDTAAPVPQLKQFLIRISSLG